jgi:hypothetical protein
MVKNGIWELSFRAQIHQTGEPVSIPKRLVRVVVERNADGAGEVAEITPVPTAPAEAEDVTADPAKKEIEVDPAKEIRPLYADIQVKREDSPPIITIHHTDAYWTFRMWGEVRDPQHIVGTKFGARHREQNSSMEGYWFMKWLRE